MLNLDNSFHNTVFKVRIPKINPAGNALRSEYEKEVNQHRYRGLAAMRADAEGMHCALEQHTLSDFKDLAFINLRDLGEIKLTSRKTKICHGLFSSSSQSTSTKNYSAPMIAIRIKCPSELTSSGDWTDSEYAEVSDLKLRIPHCYQNHKSYQADGPDLGIDQFASYLDNSTIEQSMKWLLNMTYWSAPTDGVITCRQTPSFKAAWSSVDSLPGPG